MAPVVALVVLALAAGPKRTKVAVLDISAPEDQKPKAGLLTPVVVGEFAKAADLQVISSQEISATLGLAKQRQLMGCAEDSCLAEIGGALGVDYLVSGTLGHIGTRYRLDLRLVRAANGGIAGSVGDFIAGSDDALADATVRLATTLLTKLPGHEAAASAATEPSAVGGLGTSAAAPVSHTGA